MTLKTETESTLAWVYIADVWYYIECFQKDRLATNIRTIWRNNGGSNVVLKDGAGKTIADFKILGSGWKIPGCDSEELSRLRRPETQPKILQPR